jgi:hypothetical protein
MCSTYSQRQGNQKEGNTKGGVCAVGLCDPGFNIGYDKHRQAAASDRLDHASADHHST